MTTNKTSRTTGHELRSDAAIYAEATCYSTSMLVSHYNEYADACEFSDINPDPFQRWIQREYPECCDQPPTVK
jgi:hypothetical protein